MGLPTRAGVLASTASGSTAFVTEHHYTPAGGTQVVSFSGAASGNLAIINCTFASSVSTPAGWTLVGSYNWITYGYLQATYSKVLGSGDISTGSVTVSGLQAGSIVMAAFYSGPTVATIVATGDSAGPSVSIPGFTKNGGCKGIVTVCAARDQSVGLTPPGTVVNRIPNYTSTFLVARLDDIINPSNYTNGTDLTYGASGAFRAVGQIVELT